MKFLFRLIAPAWRKLRQVVYTYWQTFQAEKESFPATFIGILASIKWYESSKLTKCKDFSARKVKKETRKLQTIDFRAFSVSVEAPKTSSVLETIKHSKILEAVWFRRLPGFTFHSSKNVILYLNKFWRIFVRRIDQIFSDSGFLKTI